MVIQWYPGHMDKALREMKNNAKLVDAILYVLDARAPFSCLNPKFDTIIGSKPVIMVLNKADLIEKDDLIRFEQHFKANNIPVVALNSTITNATKPIIDSANLLLGEKVERFKNKGVNIPLRLMVIGVPNSGKSTLINNVCGNKKTITGDKPGVTRSNQWVKISNGFELLDTPGTLWPSFDNPQVARNLAYIASIKDDVLDVEELAFAFIDDLREKYFDALRSRYNLNVNDEATTIEIFDEICQNRGFILRGGEIDYNRGARAILDDFRKGRIGKLVLD